MRIGVDGHYEHWRTPAGAWWVPQGNAHCLFGCLTEQACGIYADPRPGDVVIDCGANYGTFARQALDHGAAVVIAVEPVPENVESIARNFPREIAEGRVVIVRKGAWSSETVLKMYVHPDSSAGDSFVTTFGYKEDEMRVEELAVTTIDAITADLRVSRIDYIKMDIEGAEREALRGAVDTITRFAPRLAVSAYHLPDDPTVLAGLVARMGRYSQRVLSWTESNGGVAPEVLWCEPQKPHGIGNSTT